MSEKSPSPGNIALLQKLSNGSRLRLAQRVWRMSPGPSRIDGEIQIESRLSGIRSGEDLGKLLKAAIALRETFQFLEPDRTSDALPGAGRFLAVDLDQVVEDGHAAEDSSFHLSMMNTPRPILWLDAVGQRLLSWIPAEIVDEIDIAIECNPEGSVKWLA